MTSRQSAVSLATTIFGHQNSCLVPFHHFWLLVWVSRWNNIDAIVTITSCGTLGKDFCASQSINQNLFSEQ